MKPGTRALARTALLLVPILLASCAGLPPGASFPKRESVALIRAQGATPAAVLIALDRMERAGPDDALSAGSAVQAFEREHHVPVLAIANLNDLMHFLDSDVPLATAARPYKAAMAAYRSHYGAP